MQKELKEERYASSDLLQHEAGTLSAGGLHFLPLCNASNRKIGRAPVYGQLTVPQVCKYLRSHCAPTYDNAWFGTQGHGNN